GFIGAGAMHLLDCDIAGSIELHLFQDSLGSDATEFPVHTKIAEPTVLRVEDLRRCSVHFSQRAPAAIGLLAKDETVAVPGHAADIEGPHLCAAVAVEIAEGTRRRSFWEAALQVSKRA